MTDNNYFTICGWMINRLHLTGNKLLIYALIFSFSQAEGCSFAGPLSFITDSLGINKTTVIRLLKELINEGLVVRGEKQVESVTFPTYKTIYNYDRA